MPLNEAGSFHVKRILVAEIAVADTLVGAEAAVNTKVAHTKLLSPTKAIHQYNDIPIVNSVFRP